MTDLEFTLEDVERRDSYGLGRQEERKRCINMLQHFLEREIMGDKTDLSYIIAFMQSGISVGAPDDLEAPDP